MAMSMKGIFKMIKWMEMDFILLAKETCIMVNLKKMKKMVTGHFSSLMELFTLATGRTMKYLDLVR